MGAPRKPFNGTALRGATWALMLEPLKPGMLNPLPFFETGAKAAGVKAAGAETGDGTDAVDDTDIDLECNSGTFIGPGGTCGWGCCM